MKGQFQVKLKMAPSEKEGGNFAFLQDYRV